ncbi:MAG TPA: sodium:proton antiporter [Thermoanaerobaculia bacterium]|nr:sodium:proton antiporter [Thermoanaerobaculia bacterium]
MRHPARLRWALGTTIAGGLFAASPAAAAAAEAGPALGTQLPAWSAVPFVGILLSIALFPLLAPQFWHHHFPKISLFWGALLVVPFVLAYRGAAAYELLHIAIADYIPFVILLATLFTVGGGILVRGSLRGSPEVNVTLLTIGTLLASFIGTTGAAMILIRPLLRANAGRRHRAHTVVFFIFLVANIGGSLTPLGDPPLFLGFLRGVPFFWTFELITEWLVVAFAVLAIYYALDRFFWTREDELLRRPAAGPREPLRLAGTHNLLFLAGVLGAVILSGVWHPGEVVIFGVHQGIQNLARDAFLLLLLLASWKTTRRELRVENGFSWFPIKEVAILFAAIFATITPLLAILRAGEAGAMAPLIAAVQSPAHYFWASGVLSSFLDNAPTYLSFLSTALGRFYPGVPEREAIQLLIATHGEYLKAVSTGAVFMGANTYLGNAPNFMVKSIAEEGGVEMPSFFGYVLRYTLPVLIPVFIVTTWIFF